MIYAVIGQGKLARHLCHWFSLEGLEFITHGRGDKKESLSRADIILLAVSDTSIQTVYKENSELHDRTWIHFSGAINIANILKLHPLMSFSSKLFAQNFYQGLRWVTNQEPEVFKKLLPVQTSQISQIELEQSSRYHALCVVAGNIPHLMWTHLEDVFENDLGIPNEDFKKYIEVSVENYLEGREATGPIVRSDIETISKNLESLTPQYRNIYQSTMELRHEKY